MLSRERVLNPEVAIDDPRSQGSMLIPRWYLLVDHDSQPVSYPRREDEEARNKFLLTDKVHTNTNRSGRFCHSM